jgi:hypothetical protein
MWRVCVVWLLKERVEIARFARDLGHQNNYTRWLTFPSYIRGLHDSSKSTVHSVVIYCPSTTSVQTDHSMIDYLVVYWLLPQGVIFRIRQGVFGEYPLSRVPLFF